MNNLDRKAVNKIASSLKSIIPISKRHVSMGEERETSFNNVTMFALNGALLLMSVRIGYTMNNATFLKKG